MLAQMPSEQSIDTMPGSIPVYSGRSAELRKRFVGSSGSFCGVECWPGAGGGGNAAVRSWGACCWLVVLLGVVCFSMASGCGSAEYSSNSSKGMDQSEGYAGDMSAAVDSVAEAPASVGASVANVAIGDDGEHGGNGVTEGTAKAAVGRYIIYDTHVELLVDDYGAFETQLAKLVERHGGFIAESRTHRQSGDQQYGTWVVRVPVESYARMLAGVDALGYAQSKREQAEDVSTEYVDLQARIRNAEQLEARIVELLESRAGKLAEVLEIERELARVRETVERMQARLRFLSDRTSLATLTLDVRQQPVYIADSTPGLGRRVADAWGGAVARVRVAAENVLVLAVALTPPVLVFAPFVVLPWWVYRRRTRGRQRLEATA